MYSPELVIVLNEIAEQRARKFESVLKALLNKPPYRNTGEGVNSVSVNVVPGNANKSPDIKIEGADHLIFMDKRKMQWTKLPVITSMLKWAATKTSDEKLQKRIAWAAAWDKKKNDTHKPKPWRKKSLSETLKEMNKEIVEAFDKAIEDSFQKATQL
jgi:hypothetical protein